MEVWFRLVKWKFGLGVDITKIVGIIEMLALNDREC